MVPIVAYVILAVVLIAAAVADCRTHRVPNALNYGAMVVGLVWWTVGGWIVDGPSGAWAGAGGSIIGLLAGLVGFAVLFAMGALGGGDVKLMGAVGTIGGGWRIVLATTFYGFIVAAIIALVVMVKKGLVRRTFARLFGVALLASAKVRAELPDDSPHIPVALGVCIGGLYAGAELLLGLTTPISPAW